MRAAEEERRNTMLTQPYQEPKVLPCNLSCLFCVLLY
jgi:hypothetical protein